MDRYARALVLLAILAIYPFPVASADDTTTDTTPLTREYVDPLTLLVYHYDAGTDTLTPTGTFATNLPLYIDVDVYRSGQHPEATTGAVGQCQTNVCIAALAAVVGARNVRLVVDIVPEPLHCSPMGWTQSHSPLLGLVTYFKTTSTSNACLPGKACATIYVDSVPRASDCSTY